MSIRNLASRRVAMSNLLPVSGFRDPLSLTALAGWWDFSEASRLATATNGTGSVSNGSQIAFCADRSGNNRNATQGTANNRPTWNATGINGLGAASYAGGANALSTAAAVLTGNSPVTVFWVMARAVVAGGGMVATSGGTLATIWGVQDIYNANAQRNSFIWLNSDNQRGEVGPDQTLNTPTVGCVASPAGQRTQTIFFRNNAPVTIVIPPGANLATFSFPNAVWSLGRGVLTSAGGAITSHNGLIGEILVYGAALSVAEVAAVSRYLGAKWGITVA